nr:unnamed protein product [Digitaria exilis]
MQDHRRVVAGCCSGCRLLLPTVAVRDREEVVPEERVPDELCEDAGGDGVRGVVSPWPRARAPAAAAPLARSTDSRLLARSTEAAPHPGEVVAHQSQVTVHHHDDPHVLASGIKGAVHHQAPMSLPPG